MALPAPSARLLPPMLVMAVACGGEERIQAPSLAVDPSVFIARPGVAVHPPLARDGGAPQFSYCTGGCPTDSSVVDFEGGWAPGFTPVDSQYAALGVVFSNAVVGETTDTFYNDPEYPPRSGSAIAAADFTATGDWSGTLSFALDTSAIRVRGYITSFSPVTLQCFDAADSLLAQTVFAGANLAVYHGGPANQPVEVSATGIRRCQFLGPNAQYTVDDLTVVWVAPLPTLACDTVVRGTTGTCTVTGADSVLVWEFAGTLAFNPDGAGPVVFRADTTSSSGWGTGPDSIWSGTGVMGGTVSAKIRIDTTESTLATAWVVLPRTSGGWQWDAADWAIAQDTVVRCPYVDFVLPFKSTAPAHKGVVGYNRRQSDCTNVGSIEPNIRDTLASGSPAATGVVLDSVSNGPNKLIYFVKSASFTMDRATEMDPWFRPAGPSIPVLDSVDYMLCRDSMGLVGTPPISVNLYSYNQVCRGFDPQPWIAGILNHEGYGTQNPLDPATANGHEARRRIAASDPANDPRALTEALVHPISSVGLRFYVYDRVIDADNRISNFAADATGFVKDNYVDNPIMGDCGYLWVLFKPNSSHTQKWYRFMEMEYFQADSTLPKRCP